MEIEKLSELEQKSLGRRIPIIGSKKGAWLLEKIKELQPEKILELGTANGYSGIILGSEKANLTTIEIDPEIAEEAKQNFEKFNVKSKIIIGDVVDKIKTLDCCFDLIFIDFAKRKYLEVLDDCLRLLKEGGHLIADNITMEGCQDFREAVMNHPRLKTEIIDIKDGLSFSVKVK